jgi:hypothetical protein
MGIPRLGHGFADHRTARTGGRRSDAVFGVAWLSVSVNSFTQQANSNVMPSGSWK